MSENADLKLYADMDGLLLKINDLLLALEALLGKLPAVAGDDGREKLITLIVQLREQRAWYERTLREKMESLKGSGVMIPGLIGAVSASPVANYASYGKLWWLSRKARKQVRDGLKGKRGTDSETGSVIPSTPEELEASLNDYFKSALVLTHEGEGASEELRSQMETLGGMVRTSARLVNGVTDIPDITLHRRGSWGHDGAAPAPGETQDLKLSLVEFSAVAPKNIVKGEYTVIDVVMYEEQFRYIVDGLLESAESPAQEARSGVSEVGQDAMVKVVLSSPDVEIGDAEETRRWHGGYLDYNFAVFLPENYAKHQVFFSASVYIDDVIATRLKFVAKCSSAAEQKLTVTREDVLSAFISYASQDRNRVATVIQGMKKVRPDMDVFFDVENLRSGEDWELALHREIEKRDVFFLCWSNYARQSKWVNMEWRYALSQKGPECIEPIPFETPDICPPPSELSGKHFNDKLLYIINMGGGHGAAQP